MGLTYWPQWPLDPVRFDDSWSSMLALQTYARLFRLDSSGKAVPDLVESYRIEEGGTRHEFALDPNRRFSDGSPIQASDVVYSLRRAACPRLNSGTSFLLDRVSAVGECLGSDSSVCSAHAIEEVGKYRVVIRTASPVYTLDQILTSVSTSVLPKGRAPESEQAPEELIGSGYYRVESWSDDVIRLGVNPFHSPTESASQGIVFHKESEADSLLAYRRGERSYARVMSGELLESLTKAEAATLRERITSTFYFVVLPGSDHASLLARLCEVVDAEFLSSVYGDTQQKLDHLLPSSLVPLLLGRNNWDPCLTDEVKRAAFEDGELEVLRVPDVMSGALKLRDRLAGEGVPSRLVPFEEILAEVDSGRYSSPFIFGFIPAYLNAEALLRQWFLADGATALFSASPSFLESCSSVSRLGNPRDRATALTQIFLDPDLRSQHFPLMEERLTFLVDERIDQLRLSPLGDYFLEIGRVVWH